MASAIGYAQVAFRTIIPQKPVVVGESFQVQYILQDGDDVTQFTPPEFPGFRIVSGPSVYYGSVNTIYGVRPLSNTVYTLVPLKAGRLSIYGASAMLNGEPIRSNDNMIEVITREEALRRLKNDPGSATSDYFLAPGEDPYKKVRQNLFLKVMVDRKTCYVGEPILATFKLYSRLESKSDIVKNPGFYGFTVYDMISLVNKQTSQEKVNGTLFDVHTIRKVQLYPLQAGDFTIDRMEVKNKVEFSRSAVSRKTEQEIVEGVLGYDEEPPPGNDAEIVETEMHTEPVSIRVKPIPATKKPADFSGAVGTYSIKALVLKDRLARNEQGIFEITISGQGNFTQLSRPIVQWPSNVEGFEPVVQDVLDKNETPLKGRRVFRYTFVSSAAGEYTIPPIQFTFFKPDSGTFRTIQTATSTIHVSNEIRRSNNIRETTKVKSPMIRSNYWGIAAAALLIIGSVIVLFSLRRNRKKVETSQVSEAELVRPVAEFLQPASEKIGSFDKEFFSALHRSIWDFLVNDFSFTGSEMNKRSIEAKLADKGVNESTRNELVSLISLIESGMFTSADLAIDKKALLERTAELLKVVRTN